MNVNVRVEYELTPIRHLAIQCPNCNNWFNQHNICNESIRHSYELYYAECQCPKCNYEFKIDNPNIKECNNAEEVYKDILKRKVEWIK